jgi:putative transcriptional regulator
VAIKIVLAEIREKRGMTQEALAQALNLSLRGVQYLEYSAKAIKVDLMDQICDVLNCNPGDLFKKVDTEDGDDGDVRSEQRERKSQMMQKYWANKKRESKEEALFA